MPDSAVTTPAPTGRGAAAAGLLKACHPGPCLVVSGLSVALGVALGLGPARCVVLGSAVLAGQLTIGWLNDLHDRRDDLAAGRTDKPLATGRVGPRAVRIAFGFALVAVLVLSVALGPAPGAVNLFTVGCGWAYDLRLKRTPWSWLPFVLAFGALPAVAILAMPEPTPTPPWWACAAGALLGLGAHAANALPDIETDRALGIGGLPARLGAAGTRALAALSLGAATLILVLAPPGSPGPLGALALAGAAALTYLAVGRRWPVRSRVPFVLVAGLAVLDVLLLVARAGSWAPTG